MKVRSGFVSNSSSSSFVVAAEREVFDKRLAEQHEYVQDCVRMVHAKTLEFDDGTEVVVVYTHQSSEDSEEPWEWRDREDEKPNGYYGKMYPMEAWETFCHSFSDDDTAVVLRDGY